jgi:hypothetical protein
MVAEIKGKNMTRPDFIKVTDIKRWEENINNDPHIPKSWLALPPIKEACLAGLWLAEELAKQKCPEEIIIRIQYTAGMLCYGKDIWAVHQQILQDYTDGNLEFEDDPENTLN